MSRPGFFYATQRGPAHSKKSAAARQPRDSFVMELPDELRKRLETEAERMGLTMGQIFSAALDLYTKALDTLDQGGTITFEIPDDPDSPYVVNRRGEDEPERSSE
jgi:hypothetical protein